MKLHFLKFVLVFLLLLGSVSANATPIAFQVGDTFKYKFTESSDFYLINGVDYNDDPIFIKSNQTVDIEVTDILNSSDPIEIEYIQDVEGTKDEVSSLLDGWHVFTFIILLSSAFTTITLPYEPTAGSFNPPANSTTTVDDIEEGFPFFVNSNATFYKEYAADIETNNDDLSIDADFSGYTLKDKSIEYIADVNDELTEFTSMFSYIVSYSGTSGASDFSVDIFYKLAMTIDITKGIITDFTMIYDLQESLDADSKHVRNALIFQLQKGIFNINLGQISDLSFPAIFVVGTVAMLPLLVRRTKKSE